MVGCIYVRISDDDEGDGEAIARHERVAHSLAREHGIDVPEELVFKDNDITGSGEKVRDDYDRMVAALRDGQAEAVVTTEVERLQRGLREYVDWFEVCEARKARVVWEGGYANFATGDGIDVLEDAALAARKELRKIKKRMRRMHADMLARGKYVGPRRTFGYAPELEVIESGKRPKVRFLVVDEEAELIREASRRVLQGEAVAAICRDWAARGITSVRGNPWTRAGLRQLLVSGRISGRRDYGQREDGRRQSVPEIVTDGDWPAIISPDVSDQVRAVLANRTRSASPRRWLLTGLVKCGECGASLQPHHQSGGRIALYCRREQGYHGCGKVSITYAPIEELIVESVLLAVDRGALAEIMRGTIDQEAVSQLSAVEGKLAVLAGDWAADRLSRAEWGVAREALIARQQALQRRVDASRRRLSLQGVPADRLRDAWPSLPLHVRRAVIAAVVEKVVVHPAAMRGRNKFDPSRVEVAWRL